MATLMSFGCSLTFGTELADSGGDQAWPTASQQTWPAQLAQKFGFDYRCMAMGGAGNLLILDRLLRTRFYHPDDVFVINWTFIDRFDYSDPQGHHHGSGASDWLTVRPGGEDAVSDFYYRHLHSEYRDKLTTLVYIKTALDRLREHRARFLMTAIDDTLWDQRYHAPAHVTELQQELRPWIYSFDGRNFLDWARYRGFDITPAGHPLEKAHASAADLMAGCAKEIFLHKE